MSDTRGRTLGLGRLILQLRRGRATLNDRAWTLSPLALPVGRFLGALRERFVVMRQSSIRIAINAARLQAHTQACETMADEQAREERLLVAPGIRASRLDGDRRARRRIFDGGGGEHCVSSLGAVPVAGFEEVLQQGSCHQNN